MDLRKSAKGSISELKASIHFLGKGWSVYLPYDHDQEHDLVITKGPRIKRIQVKTIYQDGNILRANVHKDGTAKYSPDTIDYMVCLWFNQDNRSRLWVIPMEDIEQETTLNFGKVNGDPSNTRGNFNHTKYEVLT